MRRAPENDNSREFARVLKAINELLIWAEMDREEKHLVLDAARAATDRLHDRLERHGCD